jgi:hypothetical protein
MLKGVRDGYLHSVPSYPAVIATTSIAWRVIVLYSYPIAHRWLWTV